jgi:lysophospholipase L1-like esterase
MPHGDKLSNSAVRQVVHVSIGGDTLRLKLSNEHSRSGLSIKSVFIANPAAGSAIDQATATKLTFNGADSVTIAGGETAFSDPVVFNLKPLQCVAITINYGRVPRIPTIHGGSRTHSYIISGEANPATDFSEGESEVHWYSIAALDVKRADKPRCVAILGNSITDGRGSTNDLQDRWTDVFSEQFGGRVAVLNLGIGGNCVLNGGLGPTAINRYQTDILDQRGVTDVIVFEGVNDIGSRVSSEETVTGLINAYKDFIAKARKQGLKIYGGTITPMKGSDYFNEDHEKYRQAVNKWIMTSGEFDAVIDMSKVIANPDDAEQILPSFQFDTLHPNAAGYKAMGTYAAKTLGEYLK